MLTLDPASFKWAQTNGTGFLVGMCPDEVLKKWQAFAVKYDRVSDAIKALIKDEQGAIFDEAQKYTPIEAPAHAELRIFAYDADVYDEFRASYQSLTQLHAMLQFKHITTTVEFLLFNPEDREKQQLRLAFMRGLGLEPKKKKVTSRRKNRRSKNQWSVATSTSSGSGLKYKFERVDSKIDDLLSSPPVQKTDKYHGYLTRDVTPETSQQAKDKRHEDMWLYSARHYQLWRYKVKSRRTPSPLPPPSSSLTPSSTPPPQVEVENELIKHIRIGDQTHTVSSEFISATIAALNETELARKLNQIHRQQHDNQQRQQQQAREKWRKGQMAMLQKRFKPKSLFNLSTFNDELHRAITHLK